MMFTVGNFISYFSLRHVSLNDSKKLQVVMRYISVYMPGIPSPLVSRQGAEHFG